jgi:hypothetical protein
MEYELGGGALTWCAFERQTDRYGSIMLSDFDWLGQKIAFGSYVNERLLRQLVGTRGKLVADVKETRRSKHVGDVARGFYPTTPPKRAKVLFWDKEYSFTRWFLKNSQ